MGAAPSVGLSSSGSLLRGPLLGKTAQREAWSQVSAVIPSDSEAADHRRQTPGSRQRRAKPARSSRTRQAYETGTAIHGIRLASSSGSLVAHAPRDDGLMLYTVIPSDSEGSCHRQAYETGTAIHGIRRESSSGSKTPRSREALPTAGGLPSVDASVAPLLGMTVRARATSVAD